MDFYTTPEGQKIYERWSKTRLLAKLSEYQGYHLATFMENQRLINERIPADNYHKTVFRRLSVPIVRRSWGESPLWDLISIQSHLKPEDRVYHKDKYGIIRNQMMAARTRRLATYLPLVKVVQYDPEGDKVRLFEHKGFSYCFEGEIARNYLPSQIMLDNEAELSLYVSERLCNEITREVFNDLVTNSSVVRHEWKSPRHLLEMFLFQSHAKGMNWAVVSPHIALELIRSGGFKVRDDYDEHRYTIQYVGTLEKVRLYVDPLFAVDTILMGRKGDTEYEAGYILASYIPLIETAGDLAEERYHLMHRYSKRLVDASYYTQIVIDDYSYNTEEGEWDSK